MTAIQASTMLKIKRDKKDQRGETRAKSNSSKPQGISANTNALRRLALMALLTVAVPLAVGFTYLLMVRDPALVARQADKIGSAFAAQQASGIQHFQRQFNQRLSAAAQSPEALAALVEPTEAKLAQHEQAIRLYFPEAVSLHLLPIGEMGTAAFVEGDRGLRNHIELDLVRRASQGADTQPESFKFEELWLTSFAQVITDAAATAQRAVMLVSVDNQFIARQLTPIATDTGKFDLEQNFTASSGGDQAIVVASAGRGDERRYTRRADVPGTAWQVAFTPSSAFMESLAISPLPLLAALGVSLLAVLIALYLLVTRFSSALSKESDKLLAAADKKTPLVLQIPELVPIAKQLRRATLRSNRNGLSPGARPGKPAAADLTNPMFQSSSMLDGEGGEVLDLDGAEEFALDLSEAIQDDGLPRQIFRAYDIRGQADAELTDDLVTKIGKAIGTLALEKGQQSLIVGCDGRASSSRIQSTLIRALMESGRDVINIGMVPTPLLYYATRHLDCRSGVMITGSHNPADCNGFKIVIDQQTIAAGGIQDILERVRGGNFSSGQGRMMREDIIPAYIDEVVGDIAIAVPLKVVIDAGNGATSKIAPLLFEELGCEVVPLYCEVDGSFPNHPPDTSNEANLVDLVQAVQEHGADLGVAFDGDGDRLAVVSATGHIVRSDVLLMIYAEDVVSRNPGADVVFDVKCSRNLTQLITQHGGRPVLWKTGHAFMKEKMAETGALLGGEFSGHMFFGERWYGFDDGMYAAGRLAEILSTHDSSLDEAIAGLPASFNTPEILIPVRDDDKFDTMENIIAGAEFPAGKINTLDGLRVDFADGWGLIRASNTSAALTARFEASTEEGLAEVMAKFRTQIELSEPELELPF